MAKIIGGEELQRKLRKLGDLRFLRPTMKAVGVEVRGLAKVYPAPPTGSTYRRTGVLRKGWGSKTNSSGTSVTVGNAVPYAFWVQDRERQAAVHAGRWQTAQDIAEEKEADILKEIQKAVDRELAKG